MHVRRWATATAVLAVGAGLLPLIAAQTAQAAPSITVVTGGDVSADGSSGWAVENLAGGTGAFVAGTGTPPLGSGSYWLKSNATGDKHFLHLTKVAGVSLAGRPLTDLTELTFSSWAADGTFAPYVNIPVHSAYIDANKDDIADGTQPGVPGATGNAILVYDTASASGSWASRDTMGSSTWRLTRKLITPSTTVPLWTYKTVSEWTTLMTDGIFNATYGDIQWVIGDTSTPAWGGREGWVDDIAVTVGADAGHYDLEEGLGSCPVSVDAPNKTLTLTADCTTRSTLVLHDGWTLDGAGYTITAIDPDASTSFTGPVLTNEAVTDATMTIKNLHVVGNLRDGCSNNLYGVRFLGAQGSLTDVTVDGIRYGAGSGCQGGNSVDISNVGGATRLPVDVSNVSISNWQKTGLRASGNVALRLTDSAIASSNLDWITGSNSLQISRGARAYVADNTIGGNDWDGDTVWSATGVLLYGAEDVVFTRNVVSDPQTDFGMYISQAGGYPDGHTTLTCNTFSRDAAADPDPGAPDVWNTGVAADKVLLATVTAVGNTVEGFATSYDNVVDNPGGPCASGPVSALTVTGGNTVANVDWTAPTPLGYAPVSGYRVTLVPGGASQTVTTTTTQFTGLSNNTLYTATVVPLNAAGDGAATSASGWTDRGVPRAPRALHATGGVRTLSLRWGSPSSRTPITSYTVTVRSHGAVVQQQTIAASSLAFPVIVRGLAPNRSYRTLVSARNTSGDGPNAQVLLTGTVVHATANPLRHGRMHVTGRALKVGGKRGLVGVHVHLMVKVRGAATWRDRGVRATSGPSGRWSFSTRTKNVKRWYVVSMVVGSMPSRTPTAHPPHRRSH